MAEDSGSEADAINALYKAKQKRSVKLWRDAIQQAREVPMTDEAIAGELGVSLEEVARRAVAQTLDR